MKASCSDCGKGYRVTDATRTYRCKACGGEIVTNEPDPLAGLVDCPECHALNAPDSRFCEECGFDFEKKGKKPRRSGARETGRKARETVACPFCDTANPERAQKCRECGEPLSSHGYASVETRDRRAESLANRELRRAETTITMLRMAYFMGVVPAAVLLFLYGALVMKGSQHGYVIFVAATTGFLFVWHVVAIVTIRRMPLIVSLLTALVQTIACAFYLLFATSLFAVVVPPLIAVIYWGGVVPMIRVHVLLRDNPEAWAARRLR